jgi:hypothetical protein
LKSCIFLSQRDLFSPTLEKCQPSRNFAAESDRHAADARVQHAEARAADLEKFIDKERLLYSEKIRSLETTVLQLKSDMHDTKRTHDQQVTPSVLESPMNLSSKLSSGARLNNLTLLNFQDVGSIEQLKSLTKQLQKCQEALVHSAKERHFQDQSIRSKVRSASFDPSLCHHVIGVNRMHAFKNCKQS